MVARFILLALLIAFPGPPSADTIWPTTHPVSATYKQIKLYSGIFDTYSWWENGRVWMDVIPVTTGPFVCSGDFTMVQSNEQFDVRLLTKTELWGFCGDLFVPQIFWVANSIKPLDASKELLIYYDSTPRIIINVPPADTKPQMQLTIDRVGAGNVTSEPLRIDCGNTCQGRFSSGSTVALHAVPSTGNIFVGWTNGCSGVGDCFVTMDKDKTITANFDKQPEISQLGVKVVGAGNVTSKPSGITCGTTCEAGFRTGSIVELTPTANSSSRFIGWSGACEGNGVCSINMNGNKSVTASFQNTAPQKTLSITLVGNGTVTSQSGDILCGKLCQATFDKGSKVMLTVIPADGFRFKKWSGACIGKRACTVKMAGNRKVKAIFEPNQ